ncbi:hypothetical protein DSO57_1032727 [Entomophthora muscae]|uniref:Uncharacterized protein n=1 Tax=Entomophthora muscae TaxID=34485 RepID=A0ACC2S2E6_9FUNG|nr:hypothetical protein DSO57_1032727 [Entomophthora muscae]
MGNFTLAVEVLTQAFQDPDFTTSRSPIKAILKILLSPRTVGVQLESKERLKALLSNGILNQAIETPAAFQADLIFLFLQLSCKYDAFRTWTDFGKEFRGVIIQAMMQVNMSSMIPVFLEMLKQIDGQYKQDAYNAMIECIQQRVPPQYGMFGAKLIKEMVELNLTPSAEACDCIIIHLSAQARLHHRGADHKFRKTIELYSVVRTVMPHLSRETFGNLFKSYNFFLEESKSVKPMISLFSDLSKENYAPCLRLCSVIVDGCEKILNPEHNSSIDVAARIERLLRNKSMFEGVSEDDFFIVLVSCYARLSEGPIKPRSAAIDRFLAIMPEIGVQPNSLHFSAVLAAFGVIGDLDSIYRTLRQMPSYGVQPDTRCLADVFYVYLLNREPHKVVSILQSVTGEKPLPELSSINPIVPTPSLYGYLMSAGAQMKDLNLMIQSWESCVAAGKDKPLLYDCYKSATNAFRTFIVAAKTSPQITASEAARALEKLNEIVAHLDENHCVGPKYKSYESAVKAHANYLMLPAVKRKPHITWHLMMDAYRKYFLRFKRPTCPSIYSLIFDALTELVNQNPDIYYAIAPEANALSTDVRDLAMHDSYVFTSLFKLAGTAGDDLLLEDTFKKFRFFCFSSNVLDPSQLVPVFNLYFKYSKLPTDRLIPSLDAMATLQAYPDYYTYSTIFYALSRKAESIETARELFSHLLLNCSKLEAAITKVSRSLRAKYTLDSENGRLMLFKSIATCFIKLGDAPTMLASLEQLKAMGITCTEPSVRIELYNFVIYLVLSDNASPDSSLPILEEFLAEVLCEEFNATTLGQALKELKSTLDAIPNQAPLKVKFQELLVQKQSKPPLITNQ